MAIYHLKMSLVRRRDGRSAVAAAAYRSGSRMLDERSGRMHDYSRKAGVADVGLVGWQRERGDLWNEAERAERHPRAITAREVVVALPHELSNDDRHVLVAQFAEYLHRRHRVAIDWAIHRPTPHSPRNWHAHIMLTTRVLGDDRRTLGAKCRELDVAQTGSAHLRHWRATWASRVNEKLWLAGIAAEVDHRSHKAAGLHHQPMLHLGPAAAALERHGRKTTKGEHNRNRRRHNRQLEVIDAQLLEVRRAIRDFSRSTVEILTAMPSERQLSR